MNDLPDGFIEDIKESLEQADNGELEPYEFEKEDE